VDKKLTNNLKIYIIDLANINKHE